jgi:hypothetical protein
MRLSRAAASRCSCFWLRFCEGGGAAGRGSDRQRVSDRAGALCFSRRVCLLPGAGRGAGRAGAAAQPARQVCVCLAGPAAGTRPTSCIACLPDSTIVDAVWKNPRLLSQRPPPATSAAARPTNGAMEGRWAASEGGLEATDCVACARLRLTRFAAAAAEASAAASAAALSARDSAAASSMDQRGAGPALPGPAAAAAVTLLWRALVQRPASGVGLRVMAPGTRAGRWGFAAAALAGAMVIALKCPAS